MNQNDQIFRDKATELIDNYFGIFHDCRNDFYEQEIVLSETPEYRLTLKLSNSINLNFNIADPSSGQIMIKNKYKIDEKGMKFSQLLSNGIFRLIGDCNMAEKMIEKKIYIIENGYITFKVAPKLIIIINGIEDKLGNDYLNATRAKEVVFTIIIKDTNNYHDGDNYMMFGARQQQRAGYGYGNPQFYPGMKPSPGAGFRPFYY